MIDSRVTNSRQQAYLDAMGISIWARRDAGAVEDAASNNDMTLKLGAGNGGILLICSADTDSASKLANDVSRALGCVPVWSWPENSAQAVTPAVAVDENLFTTVCVFGAELAEQFFGHQFPENLKSAKMVLLPSIQDLETRADARQMLWAIMCRSGMVSASQ